MKKVRISLKRGTKSWSFRIFDSAEAAYYLKNDAREKSDNHQMLYLMPGSFMEVEWMGCEYLYESDEYVGAAAVRRHDTFSKVRVAKLTKSRDKSERDVIELAVGWVGDGAIPWSEDQRNDLRIIRINEEGKSKLDFSILFKKIWEDEEPIDDPEVSGQKPGTC